MLQAAAKTSDDHFLELVGPLFLGEYRVDQHRTTNDGEQRLRGHRQCLSVESHIRRSSNLYI